MQSLHFLVGGSMLTNHSVKTTLIPASRPVVCGGSVATGTTDHKCRHCCRMSGSGLRMLGTPVTTWLPRDGKVSRVLVWLHGSGDSGPGLLSWLEELLPAGPPPYTALLLPTAPARPYTLAGGAVSRVWHDRDHLNPTATEDKEGIQTSVAGVCGLVSEACQLWSLEAEQEVVVGGFSQGGHLALHAVYGAGLAVRAAFALSSFLVRRSSVFSVDHGSDVPLYLSTGAEDSMVEAGWVEDTAVRLAGRRVEVSNHVRPGLQHEMEADQLQHLFAWLVKNS